MSEGTKNEVPNKYIIAVYTGLFDGIWQRAADLIGDSTLQMLMKSAVDRIVAYYPFMSEVNVTSEGIILEALNDKTINATSQQVQGSLQDLVAELFSILTAMSGDVIIRELAPKVDETNKKLENIEKNNL